MKKSLCLAILLFVVVIGAKFGVDYFQNNAAHKESLQANTTYLQLVAALQHHFETHGIMPNTFSDLKFEGPIPNLNNFNYNREGDYRCIISFQGKHGSSFVHPLNYETSTNTTTGQK